MKPLLIGLAPKKLGEPGAFLTPGSSSRRIASLLGCSVEEISRYFDTSNLSSVPLEHASQEHWRSLATSLELSGRVVVACGRIVSKALDGPAEWGQWVIREDGTAITAMPHPSGLTRNWNDEQAVSNGRTTLAAALAMTTIPEDVRPVMEPRCLTR